jgi:hypothetical protein
MEKVRAASPQQRQQTFKLVGEALAGVKNFHKQPKPGEACRHPVSVVILPGIPYL